MDFASVAWWAYLLGALGGLLFGLLQSLLVKRAVLGEHPRKWLYAVKFGVWALALTGLALLSLPVLLVFVVAATVTQVIGSMVAYQKAQKEAR